MGLAPAQARRRGPSERHHTMQPSSDPLLFTPGPLTTSSTVKQAMARDLGSRDRSFIAVVAEVRERLVALATRAPAEYTAVIMQGAGTMGVEAMIGTFIPRGGKLLVAVNGAYGRRIARIAEILGIPVVAVEGPEDRPTDLGALESALFADEGITHIAAVHCETTTGVLNPIQAIGGLAVRHGRRLLVDAMSSFGAVPLDMADAHIDALVSSSNKCIQGVPGFSFCVANKQALEACKRNARSLSLDLYDQWSGLERDGQFRFTPPVQSLLAFRQALAELEAEGGVEARMARYRENHRVLLEGLTALGYRAYLDRAFQGWTITTFWQPRDPRFRFDDFYRRLAERGLVIYPGKLTQAECFRIGSIGHLGPDDMRALVSAIASITKELGFSPS